METQLRTLVILALIVPHLGFASDVWLHQELDSRYLSEGASFGDLDGDGNGDLISGPYWYAGPNFDDRFTLYPPKPARQDAFSDNFFSFVHDFNGDGMNDVLIIGFPGTQATIHLNPGNPRNAQTWSTYEIANPVGHEAPTLVDLIPGRLPELVCSRNTAYGYYQAGSDPLEPWEWHPVSVPGLTHQSFGHGLGVGDLNGDGRPDLIDRHSWWEHPSQPRHSPWTQRPWTRSRFPGGAQILIQDVDSDGDADIITSLAAHGYGIAWFEQLDLETFARHDIIGKSSTENPYGVAFSQAHGMAQADIDQDGVVDFITGKRWKGHNGSDPGAHQEPVVYWFRCVRRPEGIEWIPHLISNQSGIGMSVTIADVDGNGLPDVISANKLGLTIHRQQNDPSRQATARWKAPDDRRQDDYQTGLSAPEALRRIQLPPGFEVDLIASEPDIAQPIAMCFDARGRIWILEGHTYPTRAPEGQGKDRILILEDRNRDGNFDHQKVFVEGINLGSGLELGFGGVWVGAAPDLLFYPDADGDDRPDAQPTVLLDGWGYQDTHETLNSFTWGPDGWLYGCHGIFTHSNVGRPGTAKADRTPLNAGVWRYHPIRHEFEVFAHGTSNPWGIDFNETGDFFISACVIPHFFHMIQGGRYIRQAGQHFNPFTYRELDSIADHAHYAGPIQEHAFWGDNKITRPPAPAATSTLGGGHAHSGLAIYQAANFPKPFRGQPFFSNLHGHRLVRESLQRDGSGYVARHQPDFLFTQNHDFIGVSLMLGPGGALYFSDWVDPQTCHHRNDEMWDRSNGRIFRARYGPVQSTRLTLPMESDRELVQHLASSNAVIARHAQRVLQERSAAERFQAKALGQALKSLEQTHFTNKTIRLRVLWTSHVCGLLTPDDLLQHLTDSDEHIRAWTVQFLAESKRPLEPLVLDHLATLAAEEESLVVQRYLASLLQRLPHHQRWPLANALLRHQGSRHDRNLPSLIWYGIEPLIEVDLNRTMAMVESSGWGQLRAFATRRASATPDGRNALLASLVNASDAVAYQQTGHNLLQAMSNLSAIPTPAGWPAARARGEELVETNADLSEVLNRLGVRFQDADFFPYWRSQLQKPGRPAVRLEALRLLQLGGDPQLGALARPLLRQPRLRGTALRALRSAPGPETARALVQQVDSMTAAERTEAIQLLASHPEMALVLLEAVEAKMLPAALVSPTLLDQFARLNHPQVSALIDKNWIRGARELDRESLEEAMNEWNRKLNPAVLSAADASRGRSLYRQLCGQCHELFGEGIALGPDLTGSNRSNLSYLLENVLTPSAVVGMDYLVQVFKLKDGTVVSGLVRDQTPDRIRVALPGGTHVDLRRGDIISQERTQTSLMPTGLFDGLPLDQIADLVRYLQSPKPPTANGIP